MSSLNGSEDRVDGSLGDVCWTPGTDEDLCSHIRHIHGLFLTWCGFDLTKLRVVEVGPEERRLIAHHAGGVEVCLAAQRPQESEPPSFAAVVKYIEEKIREVAGCQQRTFHVGDDARDFYFSFERVLAQRRAAQEQPETDRSPESQMQSILCLPDDIAHRVAFVNPESAPKVQWGSHTFTFRGERVERDVFIESSNLADRARVKIEDILRVDPRLQVVLTILLHQLDRKQVILVVYPILLQ